MKMIFLLCLVVSSLAAEPLKVLFCTWRFPALAHTPEYNQAASLIDRGVDVHFFSERRPNVSVVHDIINQYNLMSRVTYEVLPDLDEYDIVHVQFAGILHEHLEPFSKYSGKIVCSSRGYDTLIQLPKHPKEIPVIKKIVDLYLPVSQSLKAELTGLGIDSKKIAVLHSTINLDKFHFRKTEKPLEGKIKITSVCRLVEKKGLDDALRAIAKVKKVYPNIEYTIIGSGECKDDLVKLMHQLNIQDIVVFAGEMSQEDVSKALDRSHLFLLPSKATKNRDSEGIPNALKEAMAVGLPVVSTKHAGIPELVENKVSGFLVSEGKPKKLAKKILHLINHPEIWESMGRNGRAVIERDYDMNVVNEKLFQHYLSLTKN